VVLDVNTGLLWKRCSVGQTYSRGGYHGAASKLDWADAQRAAEAIGDGWRLPTQAELAGLVLPYCSNPVTDPAVFPNLPQTSYWSVNPDRDADVLFFAFERGSSTRSRSLVRHQRPHGQVPYGHTGSTSIERDWRKPCTVAALPAGLSRQNGSAGRPRPVQPEEFTAGRSSELTCRRSRGRIGIQYLQWRVIYRVEGDVFFVEVVQVTPYDYRRP
jgi:hypothetical protein